MATWTGPFKTSLTSLDSLIPKSPAKRTNLRDISYTSQVIADFISNFVAMAMVIGRSRICLASFNSPTPKIHSYTQRSRGYLLHRPSYIRFFVPNFVAMATRVGRGTIWLVSFNSRTPKTPCYTQRSPGYLLYRPSYSRFCPKFR